MDEAHKYYNYELVKSQKEDQKTNIHSLFYANCGKNTQFNELYIELIKNQIYPLFNEKIVYQAVPTFRVHLPNNLAVAEYHKDRDYFHNPHEVNFFLPLTKAFDSNTIWIETYDNSNIYYPLEADYGEIIIFDGANLNHGNKTNNTNKTRISVDFRAMPLKYFEESSNISISAGVSMKIGDYYSIYG